MERIMHPLRLAAGSHQAGSGKGCAMNVISWLRGDAEISDFPDCTARHLAVLVQCYNDTLAGADMFLSPQNSVMVLDLAWRTVGTAEQLTGAQLTAWLWDLNTQLNHIESYMESNGSIKYDGPVFRLGHAPEWFVEKLGAITCWAVDSWRLRAGLDQSEDVSVADINVALGKMLCTHT